MLHKYFRLFLFFHTKYHLVAPSGSFKSILLVEQVTYLVISDGPSTYLVIGDGPSTYLVISDGPSTYLVISDGPSSIFVVEDDRGVLPGNCVVVKNGVTVVPSPDDELKLKHLLRI